MTYCKYIQNFNIKITLFFWRHLDTFLTDCLSDEAVFLICETCSLSTKIYNSWVPNGK